MCAIWRSCVTCGTCPPCINFISLVIGCRFRADSPDAIGRRMPVPAGLPDAIGRRLPVPGRFVECRRTSDVGSPPDVGCRLRPVCRMPSDVGCRFRAGSPDAAGRRMPVRRYTAGRRMPAAGCHRYRSLSDAGPPVATGTHHRRMPGHRSPPVPVTVGCRATGPIRRRRRSGAGCFVPPVRFWFVKTFTCG